MYSPGSRISLFILIFTTLFSVAPLHATKLAGVSALDRDFIMVHFLDGEVTFKDDASGDNAYQSFVHEVGMDTVKTYGDELSTTAAATPSNWTISSEDDANYGSEGKNPTECFRKSKLNGMSEQEWVSSDFNYEYTMEHFIYLKLPSPLEQGSTYTLSINSATNTDRESAELIFDIFTNRSEAIHINLVGYGATSPSKAVDLYYWMGDGAAREYKSFEGNNVYIYNVETGDKVETGTVSFWKKSASEAQWYNLTGSSVWNADFPDFSSTGTYRIAIEGVGCSQDFTIAENVYYEPFRVSVLGFFYMRIGQDSTGGIRPVPRRPLWLPGKDPAGTKVFITTMHPYHDEWETFGSGDKWDKPDAWIPYKKEGNPTNDNAYGGHSDALDWDRHLGHVSIIYDMLLPFILTKGAIANDDLGIAESGNGIPDILDEARNEVDFWLRLRDGRAYSHGLTNPNDDDELYQAGTTAIAAWANAFNSAMLADCFRIAGKNDLMGEYRDSAIAAFAYAEGLSDQMLDEIHGVGDGTVNGADLKMSAAAYLYNITGETKYEDIVNDLSAAKTATSELANLDKMNQVWGTAGYLFTPQTINYPELAADMKASIMYDAKRMEADYILTRPSRRASDNDFGYFQTSQNVHRTMVAHAVCDDAAEKEHFLKALILEADWGLGRNPLNIIQMTTASTKLQNKRSIENCYTSGGNDGTPGMHPGHTPYMNVDDWACGMVMGCPSWLTEKGYPEDFSDWPKAEAYFNTRYVWAHGEFTPQQTMRGKTALYGYLHGLSGGEAGVVYRFSRENAGEIRKTAQLTIGKTTLSVPGGDCLIRIFDLAGRVVWSGRKTILPRFVLPASLLGRSGVALVEVRGSEGNAVRHRVLTLK